MTSEEKQLLLIDLCARLPYGVKILDISANVVGDLFLISTTDTVEYEPAEDETNDNAGYQTLYNIKPYLRPMSSMTEEEKKEFDKVLKSCNNKVFACPEKERRYNFFDAEQEDFMNAHHFDYRGLIEKGLAIEAPDGMYKTE